MPEPGSKPISPEEAAAVAAAIERFVAETAPAAAEPSDGASAWQRVALVEGVSARGAVEDPEGGFRWR